MSSRRGSQDGRKCVCVCVCVPSMSQQRQVTKQIMTAWTLHRQMARNPPTDRMRDVHMLHKSQSMPMLDEDSSLRRDVCVGGCLFVCGLYMCRRGSQDGRKAVQ